MPEISSITAFFGDYLIGLAVVVLLSFFVRRLFGKVNYDANRR